MNTGTDSRGHRKPFIQAQPRGWWWRNPFYRRYMMREATSLFVLAYCLNLVAGLWCLSAGEQAWQGWLLAMQQPPAIVLHLLALLATLYHAHTFFQLFPKVVALRIGTREVPATYLVAAQWAGVLVCTAVILWIATGIPS